MESNIDPRIRKIILEDLLNGLFKTQELPFKVLQDQAKVDRYLTTGLNLCDDVNEFLIIIPDYLVTSIKRVSLRNLKLPKEIPERFTEFLKRNQPAIELIAFIHMSNILTK